MCSTSYIYRLENEFMSEDPLLVVLMLEPGKINIELVTSFPLFQNVYLIREFQLRLRVR